MDAYLKKMHMKPWRWTLSAIFLIAAGCTAYPVDYTSTETPASDARANHAVVRVVTSGGFAATYDVLAPMFEASQPITLMAEYGSSSGNAHASIPNRLQRGEQFDIIILSRNALDTLTRQGYVRPEFRTDMVRSKIGMAVQQGTPHPDISSNESFIKTLLDAESIGYSASVSGTYLAQTLWPRLGLSEILAPKAKRILSKRVASAVARGEVAIGFQQISEIIPIEGAELVGPIPEDFQKVTTFSMGITTHAANKAAAQLLLDYLSSVEAAPVLFAVGLEPVNAAFDKGKLSR